MAAHIPHTRPQHDADAAPAAPTLADLQTPPMLQTLLDQVFGTHPALGPWELEVAEHVLVRGPRGGVAGTLPLDISGQRDFTCPLCAELSDLSFRETELAADVCTAHFDLRVLELRWKAFDRRRPDPTDWGYEPEVRQPEQPRPDRRAAAAVYAACTACQAIRADRCPIHGPGSSSETLADVRLEVRLAVVLQPTPAAPDAIRRQVARLQVLDHPAVHRRDSTEPIDAWAVVLWPGAPRAVVDALRSAGLTPLTWPLRD